MRYEVFLESYVPQLSTVIVEADGEEQAKAIALTKAEQGNVFWEDCDSSCRDIEISDVEILEGADNG
jgi:hypothetical protein